MCLCLGAQQADTLKMAGLRVALMCAGVAETLSPDDSESGEDDSDDEGTMRKRAADLPKPEPPKQHFSEAEARAIAEEIGEWNGDGDEAEADAWRGRLQGIGEAASKGKRGKKKGGEVDVKAKSGMRLKGRLGPTSSRCDWHAYVSEAGAGAGTECFEGPKV